MAIRWRVKEKGEGTKTHRVFVKLQIPHKPSVVTGLTSAAKVVDLGVFAKCILHFCTIFAVSPVTVLVPNRGGVGIKHREPILKHCTLINSLQVKW
jgi:hypothetical protein